MIKDDLGEVYQDIPLWHNGAWSLYSFSSREEMSDTLEQDYFKEPGEYQFDDIVYEFQKQGIKFKKDGYFCDASDGTKDFIDYWDDQKLKSRKGVLFWKDDRKYYLPRDYYFWINFLPIIDKVKRKTDLPDIHDAQYHMSLYETIGELKYKHGVVLKKRQFGSSFYHAAKLINILWFEYSPVLKIGSSLSAYVTGVNGTWKMLQEYRNFLNTHTAWYRPMNPGGVGEWQQKIEYVENGRKTEKGRKGVLQALSFEQSDTAGVGGLCTIFFYEEAGIAKSMDKTYEFMLPALQAGEITTGYFIASGTVGDLKQCEPLRKYMYKANGNGFYEIPNKWADSKGTVLNTGLFIPEQWSMPPYIDEFGNSKVQEALDALVELKKQWKKDLDPETYQIRCSQRPTNMEEAFAFRGESIFPLELVKSHKRDIEEGDYPYSCFNLSYNNKGEIVAAPTSKKPILTFPVEKNSEDKSGAIQVWEEPDEEKEFCTTYYASVDPVSEGKTVTSDSLCSIHVYKNPVQVQRVLANGEVETFIEGDKIVCSWCGRFDDINKTHERLELIIEWYQAWTVVENNVPLFIQYMQFKRKQKYLVPSSQIVFSKEVQMSKTQFQQYGWRNVSTIFKTVMLSYLIEYLREELDEETDENGKVYKKHYGISRIPDYMAMVEMEHYQPGVNVDRLISLGALITFVKIQEASRGLKKRTEYDNEEHLEKSENLYKLNKSPFRHIGSSGESLSMKKPRNPFKNIR
jgi:hypothetical protein